MHSAIHKPERRVWSAVLAALLVLQLLAAMLPGASKAWAAVADGTLAEQPGGAAKWVVAGSFQGWNNASADTQMKHLVGGFYEYSQLFDAGHYEFKLVRSGTWGGFDGNGNNFQFDLTAQTKVSFYVNDDPTVNQARINLAGVNGLQQYIPALDDAHWPRLVGSLQPVFGEPVWSPADAKQLFVDYKFDGTVYKIQRTLPVGSYEAKAVLGNSWDGVENIGADGPGGSNLTVKVLDPADVTFTMNYGATKTLSHDYVPKTSSFDGAIDKSNIIFDSRSVTYKKPFGAIQAGTETLTLRISALRGDVQLAKAELTNPDGVSIDFTMHRVTTVDTQDYFEVIIPKDTFTGKIGVWGYKFILVDGPTKVEYGDDTRRGAAGAVVDDGAVPYDLTVYDPNYKTPSWMKQSVVYQIFPDRFFDGNKANNRSKTADGARGALTPEDATSKGGQKLQYFDGGVPNDATPDQVWGGWADVPENPDRIKPENQPYYPGAKSDGAWTNEFYGGDIQGIEQKLDYLKSLGITAIYLNPVAWAASNHKYDATDYKHLDPMFGEPVYNTGGDPNSGLNYEATRGASDRVYQAFAKAAKAKGIRLINDGVFNHVGDDSIYFDRYGKYPEIGAYEYWAKVYELQNATPGMAKEQAEVSVRASFTGTVNPLTGVNYKYPDDFVYTTWFSITNEKVKNRDDDGLHYKYDAWWGYDSLPAMDAKEPQEASAFFQADTQALPGQHEWNNIDYRENVIGHELTALSDAQAQQAMQQANSQRWLWMGSSGWRLDVAPDVSNGTWQKFRKAVKSASGRLDASGSPMDDPVILGEEWGVATRYLLGDQFDSVMNYRFRAAVQAFMISGNAGQMNSDLESIREDYPHEAWQAMMNLVDSHDTTRSITKYDKPQWEEEHLAIAPEASDRAMKLQQLTAIMQLGYPGAPTIYYGDEVGVAGTKDPDSRRSFPWERIASSGGMFSGTGRYAVLFDTYQKAAAIRNSNPVFSTGELKTAYANGDVIAYARKNDTKGGLLAVNRSDTAQTIVADVTGFLPDGLMLIDQLGASVQATVTGGKLNVTIPPMSGLMLISTANLTVVPAVTNLQAAPSNAAVNLSWEPVGGATGYRVYRALIEGGALEKIGEAASVSYTDNNVQNGKKYYYTVTAVVGTGESTPSGMATATPFYPIQSVAITVPANDMTVGVGRRTSEIQVTINIPGLTDNPVYASKEAPGLLTDLLYGPDNAADENLQSTKLRYKNDTADGSKTYWAVFEPTQAGAYRYVAAISSDNGESYFKSAAATVQVNIDAVDAIPPGAPSLGDIPVESNLVHLKWNSDGTDVNGYEIYRQEGSGAFRLISVSPPAARDYTDYTVSNDTAYTYQVAAFDASYNRAFSTAKSVTPKLVMVDVKLRLHLPEYTPTSDGIYMAGSLNGWNAGDTSLHVPSGATDRSVVEYSFKMMAGKSIEYKYTRGSWSTEAFTSHTRIPNDMTDPGNWAYSSTDTNMKLTIKNQGDNQMIVDDYVLRWVDMPMTVSLPRTSYGSDIEYSTNDATMNLKAVVPFGVAFTLNGQPLPAAAMDAQGHVELSGMPLQPGLNTFVLHIEPTQETLNLPWYTDKGRSSQATKTLTIRVTRTTAEENVESIKFDASEYRLAAGEQIATVLKAVYASGKDETLASGVVYVSSDPSTVTVSTYGSLLGQQPGNAIITAYYGALRADVPVTVTVKDLIIPAQHFYRNMKEGQAREVVVLAVYGSGKPVLVTDRTFIESSNPSVIDVITDRSGKRKLYAKKPGTASVSFRFGGITKMMNITVVRRGEREDNGDDESDNEDDSKQDKPEKSEKPIQDKPGNSDKSDRESLDPK